MLLDSPHLLGVEKLTDSPNYNDIHPDMNALPGGVVARDMLGGLMWYALLFTLVGTVASAGIWAIGSFSSNYTQSVNGKKMFLICAASALFIGASYSLVAFFYNAGTRVT